jgi:hypothetical protein
MSRPLTPARHELQNALRTLRELHSGKRPQPIVLLELAELVENLPQPTKSLTTLMGGSLRLWATKPAAEQLEPGHDKIIAILERWIKAQLKRGKQTQ